MSLTAGARALVGLARVAAELAAQIDDLTHTAAPHAPVNPLRPVETAIVDLAERGVLDLVTAAEGDLVHARLRTTRAARALERARDAVSGDAT